MEVASERLYSVLASPWEGSVYVMSNIERVSDSEVLSCVADLVSHGADFSILDPGHRLVREDAVLRAKVLEHRYRDVFIKDALETGHCFMGPNGQLLFRTAAMPQSFVGIALEAYVVRCFNDNMRVTGRLALQWCSFRTRRPTDAFVDKFVAIGTGLARTRQAFPLFYAPQSGVDVLFITRAASSGCPTVTHEPLHINGTGVAAGIQIKAIQGNERAEIIDPLLKQSYLKVLTLLRRPDGRHSADVCHEIIGNLARGGEITHMQRLDLENRICRPEQLGLDQREIDWYYEYAIACVEGRARLDDSTMDAIAMEVKEWKYGAAGTLLPGSELR
jgi:hypothetical protein